MILDCLMTMQVIACYSFQSSIDFFVKYRTTTKCVNYSSIREWILKKRSKDAKNYKNKNEMYLATFNFMEIQMHDGKTKKLIKFPYKSICHFSCIQSCFLKDFVHAVLILSSETIWTMLKTFNGCKFFADCREWEKFYCT